MYIQPSPFAALPAIGMLALLEKHRLEERIRAHVTLCWLALLLVRIIETSTDKTWPAIRSELQRLHVGTFTGPAGMFRQRTELTKPVRDLLAKLQLTTPKPIIELATAGPATFEGCVTQSGHATHRAQR